MQRYFTKKLENNKFILSDDDLYHIKTVMRLKENDIVEVVYDEKVFEGIITSNGIVKGNKLTDKIDHLDVTLILPLLKENKIDLILQKATELGVTRIIPVHMQRSVVKLNSKEFVKKQERWSRICKEASEQSKRTDIPVIEGLIDLKDLNVDGLKIVCSTTENHKTIKNVLKSYDKCDKINIVIGPEGGLTEAEENLFVDMGFVKTSLGKLIMRVETVPIYIMSVLNYEMME